MKKILIGVIIALLIVFICFALIKGISIGSFKIESIKQLKEKSANLDNTLSDANDLTKKTYPAKIDDLNSAIKKLKAAKEEYENKTANIPDAEKLGVVQVKKYKIEFLWTTIGNYATKNGATLTLDIKNTEAKDTYDLDFTVSGTYISITDFIYDIEDDENLKFEIQNFNLETLQSQEKEKTENTNTTNSTTNTNTTNSTTNSTTNTNTNTNTVNEDTGKILKATFTVKDIGIELD